MEVRCPHRAGGFDLGGHCFRRRAVGIAKYGNISDPRMGPYLLQVRRGLDVILRGRLLPSAGSMGPSQLATSRWLLGFPHLPGRYRCQVAGDVDLKEFMTRGWDSIPSGCGGTSTLSRRVLGLCAPGNPPSADWGGFFTP